MILAALKPLLIYLWQSVHRSKHASCVVMHACLKGLKDIYEMKQIPNIALGMTGKLKTDISLSLASSMQKLSKGDAKLDQKPQDRFKVHEARRTI